MLSGEEEGKMRGRSKPEEGSEDVETIFVASNKENKVFDSSHSVTETDDGYISLGGPSVGSRIENLSGLRTLSGKHKQTTVDDHASAVGVGGGRRFVAVGQHQQRVEGSTERALLF